MARIVSGPYVSGRVTAKQTGTPIAGVTVTVSGTVYTDVEMTAGTTTLTTNGDGVFVCYALPGTYTFTTTAVDAAPIEPVEILGAEGLGTDRATVDLTTRLRPRGAWVTATVYAVNDAVTANGVAWRCILAHTSGGSFTADPAKWERFGVGQVVATAPTSPATDDLWFDKANDLWKRWTGSAWFAGGLGLPPSGLNIRYVATTGSDSNDGRTWATAYATVPTAVTAVAAGVGWGQVIVGPGTFDIPDTVTLKQGVQVMGAGAAPAASGGTTLRWTGVDDGRAAIETSSATDTTADWSFGQLVKCRLTTQTTQTIGVGLHWRNAQNQSYIEDLFITGFGVGVLADNNHTTARNTFPGWISARRVWCSSNVVNWKVQAPFTTMVLDMCKADGGAGTTDNFIVTAPPAGATGKFANMIFTGYASENAGDPNQIVVQTDCQITLVGGAIHCSTPGTKAAVSYTAIPGSANIPAGRIPVEIRNLETQNIPTALSAPNVTPAITLTVANPAGGETAVTTFSGMSLIGTVSGTASATTFLRGDGTWSSPTVAGGYARRYPASQTYLVQDVSGTATAIAATLGSLDVAAFTLAEATTLDQIAAEVTTGGGAGAHVRLGIYLDNAHNYPGNLLYDSGQLDASAAAVVSANPAQTIQPGIYWVGLVTQDITSTLRAWGSTSSPLAAMTGLAGGGINQVGWRQTGVTAALPATFTATRTSSATVYRVGLRKL